MDDKFKFVEVLPFVGAFVVFAAFRVLDVIHWPWLWVAGPVWIPVVLFFVGATFLEHQEHRRK